MHSEHIYTEGDSQNKRDMTEAMCTVIKFSPYVFRVRVFMSALNNKSKTKQNKKCLRQVLTH